MWTSLPSPTPSPPHLFPLGATWRGYCCLFSRMISYFLEIAPSLGWPNTQLEFSNFLCSRLSLGISSLYPSVSFLHLGLLL